MNQEVLEVLLAANHPPTQVRGAQVSLEERWTWIKTHPAPAKRSFLFSLLVQNHPQMGGDCSLLLIFISIPLILSDPVQSRRIKVKMGKCIK